jgi:hypothetical protein
LAVNPFKQGLYSERSTAHDQNEAGSLTTGSSKFYSKLSTNYTNSHLGKLEDEVDFPFPHNIVCRDLSSAVCPKWLFADANHSKLDWLRVRRLEMPLLILSNSQRHQGMSFALAIGGRCVQRARLVRNKPAAGLDSSTSATSCSSDDDSFPPRLTTVEIAPTNPPRKSCLTVRTLAQSLGDLDRSSCRKSHGHVRGNPKSVTWSQTIQIQNYTTVLGDHPCTSRGPPISFGRPVGPPMYANMAPLDTTSTTSTLDLLIPAHVRERILIKAGYSRSELKDMEFKLLRIKLARRENAKQTLWEVLAKTTTKVSKRLSYSPSQPVS